MNTKQIETVFNASASAYSRVNYSDAAWREAIRFLARKGWSAEAIEETLRSKWMRWGHDDIYGCQGKKPTGKLVSKFLQKHIREIAQMLKDELGILVPEFDPKPKAARDKGSGTYRFTWRHEITFKADNDYDAHEIYESLDLNNLKEALKSGLIEGCGHVELVSAECVSDDYREI